VIETAGHRAGGAPQLVTSSPPRTLRRIAGSTTRQSVAKPGDGAPDSTALGENEALLLRLLISTGVDTLGARYL
jgi:hypothetical protein